MSEKQREYFKHKLLRMKQETLVEPPIEKEGPQTEADILDAASRETDYSIAMATHQREQFLLHKIDDALKRIDEGTYGYCEETGEPIGIERLVARPIATLSIEAQEKFERDYRGNRPRRP